MADNAIVNFDTKPLCDVANNLIDKVAQGIGWIATPRGTRKDRNEAVEYYFNEIKNDPNLPTVVKAQKMCTVRKDLKEYCNQSDILDIALSQLSNDSQPNKVDDDWLSHFFDEAKHVSDDDLKLIWGKLLANECNEPESVPKSLIQALSYISTEQSFAFNTICNCTLYLTSKIPIPFIAYQWNRSFYKNLGLSFFLFEELEKTGLINFEKDCLALRNKKQRSFNYFGENVTIKNDRGNISIGNVTLTLAGRALCKAITPEPIEGLFELFKKYAKKSGYEILE